MFFLFISIGLILSISGGILVHSGSFALGWSLVGIGIFELMLTMYNYYKKDRLKSCNGPDCNNNDHFLGGLLIGDCISSAADASFLADCGLPECSGFDCDCSP